MMRLLNNKSSSFIRLVALAFMTEEARESYFRLPALPARDIIKQATLSLEGTDCTPLTIRSDFFAVHNLKVGKI